MIAVAGDPEAIEYIENPSVEVQLAAIKEWPGVINVLAEVGYAGTYMVEISDCPPEREPKAAKDIQTSYDNLSRFLGMHVKLGL